MLPWNNFRRTEHMKKFLFIFLLLLSFMESYAQKFSPEEYQARFVAYVTEKAGLTVDEAGKFFPLYAEMKDKQRKYFHEIRNINFKTDVNTSSEATFRQLNDRIVELNMNIQKLEAEYLGKIRQVISDKKYFLIRKAEESFQYQELRKAQHNRKQ